MRLGETELGRDVLVLVNFVSPSRRSGAEILLTVSHDGHVLMTENLDISDTDEADRNSVF